MGIRRWLAVTAAVAVLSGCFESETLIKVNTDGSGTVEQTILLSPTGMAFAAEMIERPTDDALWEMAGKMGPGVAPVSAEPTSDAAGRQGLRTVFQFKSLGDLRVSQNMLDDGDSPAPYRFAFAAGTPARLEIRQDNPLEDAPTRASGGSEVSSEAAESMTDAGQMEMLKTLLSDMRVTIAIEVNGQVVTSNASHRDGSRITLLDIPFSRILDDPDALGSLVGGDSPDPATVARALAEKAGVTVELQDLVVVEFR